MSSEQIVPLKYLWRCSYLSSIILYDKTNVAYSGRVRNIFFILFSERTLNEQRRTHYFVTPCDPFFEFLEHTNISLMYNNIFRFKEITFIIYYLSFWTISNDTLSMNVFFSLFKRVRYNSFQMNVLFTDSYVLLL